MALRCAMSRACNARWVSKLHSINLNALVLAGAMIVIAAIPSQVRSQTVGPGPVTTTINVTSGNTTVLDTLRGTRVVSRCHPAEHLVRRQRYLQ